MIFKRLFKHSNTFQVTIAPYLLPRLILNGLVGICALFLVELGIRAYLDAFPIYVTQAFQSNAEIGWTLIPNSDREYSTGNPTCLSFQVRIKANSSGFYDREHSHQNPNDAFRIAVLGDSIIMAQEVTLQARATTLLEARLNDLPEPQQYEVLNFGMSTFSIGQYVLTYEHYARPFAPQVVFMLISELEMERTSLGYSLEVPTETGDPITVKLRPLFELDKNGVLQLIPTQNTEFLHEVFDTELGEDGQPIPHKVTRSPVMNADATPFHHPYAWLRNYSQLLNVFDYSFKSIIFDLNSYLASTLIPPSLTLEELDPSIHLALHYALLRELQAQVEAEGGRLVLLDNSQNSSLRDEFSRFATAEGLGYINLRAAIDHANQKGITTRFLCDAHFNPTGHTIVADLMFDWLQTNREDSIQP